MTTGDEPRAPLDLRRPRDVGGLVSAAFTVYLREFRTFLTIAAAVVIPVQLIVAGIGLGELTRVYDPTPSMAAQLIPIAASGFVISPLVTAMCIYALLDVADGRRPSAAKAIQRGLDVFAPLLVVILLYTIGVTTGLLLLVVPGIYLFVRFAFVMQTAVVEGKRGFDALRRSGELVTGSWWRVLGVTLAATFLVGGLSSLVRLPFLAAAESADSAAFALAGTILGGLLFAAPGALITSLLYFDQRLRKRT